MTGPRSFSAPIEQASGGGAYVTVPFDVEAAYGKKRVPVQATIDGQPYRGSLVRTSGQCHVLGVLKEIRERIGKQPGDVAPAAHKAFEALSYSHQREHILWIEEAKRAETRASRIARWVEKLEQDAARGRPTEGAHT